MVLTVPVASDVSENHVDNLVGSDDPVVYRQPYPYYVFGTVLAYWNDSHTRWWYVAMDRQCVGG